MKKKPIKEYYIGQWHMGHIALFGAILMSHGIVGKDKEFLKKLMYQALKGKEGKAVLSSLHKRL